MAELDEIFAGREVASNEPQAKEQPTEPAPQNAGAAPENAEHDAGEREANVPHAALHKEREKVKRYTEEVADMRRQMAESDARWQQRVEQLVQSFQKPPQAEQPVDFWSDPEAVVNTRVQQVQQTAQQQVAEVRENFSRMMAEEKHGAEAVQSAYQALAGMRGQPGFEGVYRQIMSSPHPYGALVQWHNTTSMLNEIGSDPAAYKERLKAELLAELQANNGGNAPQAQQPAVMPSNFATARNVGQRSGPAWAGATPLADIFKR